MKKILLLILSLYLLTGCSCESYIEETREEASTIKTWVITGYQKAQKVFHKNNSKNVQEDFLDSEE